MTHADEITAVHDSVRRHESTGRALLYSITGEPEVEGGADALHILGVSGRSYLNWGGYGVFLLGHAHAEVVAAVRRQAGALALSSRAFPHAPILEFHKEAIAAIPPHLSKFMLLTTGAEAVEAALKLARTKTRRSEVLHLEHSYHGKTQGALSVTDCELFRGSLSGLDLGARRISRSDAASASATVREVRPACVIVEPIQGEGGIFPLSPEFLRALASACHDSGSLLICDEIQCGLGRSGEMWAHQAAGIEPDILLAGKALGGGVMPISAVIATRDAFQPFDRDPILHSSTFGGNPLAVAAATATLRTIRASNLVGRAYALGVELGAALSTFAARHSSLVAQVSGRGLLYGLHFREPDRAAIFLRSSVKEGLLLTPCLTSPSIIRISPPAVSHAAALEQGLAALERAARRTYEDSD